MAGFWECGGIRRNRLVQPIIMKSFMRYACYIPIFLILSSCQMPMFEKQSNASENTLDGDSILFSVFDIKESFNDYIINIEIINQTDQCIAYTLPDDLELFWEVDNTWVSTKNRAIYNGDFSKKLSPENEFSATDLIVFSPMKISELTENSKLKALLHIKKCDDELITIDKELIINLK